MAGARVVMARRSGYPWAMLKSASLSTKLIRIGASLLAGACACGNLRADARTRVIPIVAHEAEPVRHCARPS